MLLAEDLLLLVTDDASGRLSVPGVQADAGLGGANLVELTLLGKVDVAGEQDPGKPGRVIPHPDLAGAGSQPRGRDAPARDPGAGPAVRAGRADRRAHCPAARAQVRAQGR